MPSRLRRLAGVVFCAVTLAAAAPAPAADANQAQVFIEDLGTRAIDVLADESLSNGDRDRRFRDLLREGFAVPAIGRFVLGRYWRSATKAEQQEYQELFEELIVLTYSARLSQYSGETLAVTGARADGKKGSIVDSTIVRDPEPPVRVQWRVRERKGSLKIVDVVVEGVSMAVTQRSEFASVIRQKGGQVSGLLEDLRAKVASLKANNN